MDGHQTKLHLWDIPGTDKYSVVQGDYYDVVIVVFDVTDRSSFEGV